MKNTFLKLFCATFLFSTIAYLMDGDAKEQDMGVRFAEFAGMLTIIYLMISVI